LEITIEKPRLGVPACLIVDDPAPCINPFYYYRLQVDRLGWERHEQHIPLDFVAQFARVCRARGMRGKFSVLPYPAGLGSILEGWEGCDRAELGAWLEIVRAEIAPHFDITPEILTHTLALDLETRALRSESEHEWMAGCSPTELRAYLDAALAILAGAGFASAGITQPCSFAGSREAYARATLEAIRAAGGPPVTYYFIDGCFDPPPVPEPQVVLLDRQRGEAVVDIVAYCDDPFWPTQRVTSRDAEQLIDAVITADGRGGRLPELAAAGAWLIFVCHWQTLYSDGRRQGLAGLDQIGARLQGTYGERLLWLTPGEISRYQAASEACAIDIRPGARGLAITLDSAFDCPDFTISLEVPRVAEVRPLCRSAAPDGLLGPGYWRQRGDRASLCLDLRRGRQELLLSW
jgi:hypothetical protein